MKLRYLILVFSLCMAGVFIAVGEYNKNDFYTAIDMVELNKIYKTMEAGIEAGQDVNLLEKKYDCEMVMRKQENYEERVNEAVHNGSLILDFYQNGMITGKMIFSGYGEKYEKLSEELEQKTKMIIVAMLLIGYGLFFVLYYWFIRPFHCLESFAINISKGDLEIPLPMKKGDYFGAFTESFDIMREELASAKEGEYQANLSKKELVASLSHDIKTPVATIKALCEILMIKIKETENLEKVQVIDQKADMIDKLISNMFHATLEELEVLKIEPEEELSTVILCMFEEINHFGKIELQNEIPECLIYTDKLRLHQVIDNIINNSYKYADTKIQVEFDQNKENISIRIRDYGRGVTADELPLVMGKFYRGENAKGKSGSGLGLYLSNLFMKGMLGDLECYCEDGFVAVLSLKKV